MQQLTSVKLEDGTVIYIEPGEDIIIPKDAETNGDEEESPVTRGGSMETAVKKVKSVEETIKAYTNHTLNAFRDIAFANIDKVTLEFGVKVGGEAGIPYVTKGTAESNLKVTVECSFPKK
ncbi:MAG: hypothetical protein GY749_43695 [Desulfobacteraceae bacterium]|nr:hypothetical protein [Desulfobacteraceae bacterium]